MHDLGTRGSPLEYWFWKVRTPAGGAIVDYVVRRETGTAEVRVSTWRPGVHPVIHEASTDWSDHADGIRIGESRLDAKGSAGSAGDVRWDVRWELGEPRLAPRPDWFGPLHPFDMELVARPHAHVTGLLRLGPTDHQARWRRSRLPLLGPPAARPLDVDLGVRVRRRPGCAARGAAGLEPSLGRTAARACGLRVAVPGRARGGDHRAPDRRDPDRPRRPRRPAHEHPRGRPAPHDRLLGAVRHVQRGGRRASSSRCRPTSRSTASSGRPGPWASSSAAEAARRGRAQGRAAVVADRRS